VILFEIQSVLTVMGREELFPPE